MSFTHLHVHTEYSLLDGLSKIKPLVEQAKNSGMTSLAITDHGVMYGAIEFYKACLEAGIKPILGMEAYVSKGPHTLKEKSAENGRDSNHLVLLAKDHAGYQNLMRLTTIAHLEGFYYKPRFDKDTLEKHKNGLICLSACMAGEVAELLAADEYDKAKQTAIWYSKLFGKGNYFLELQRHKYSDYANEAPDDKIAAELVAMSQKENLVNLGLIKLSRELAIPLVATNDVHYIKSQQAAAQDALVCIQTGKQVADTKRLRYVDTPTFYLTTTEEMTSLFADLPEAISNTQIVADQCNIEITLGNWNFPKFEIPGGLTAGEYLKKFAYEGAQRIYGEITTEVSKRLDYELDVIEQRGYSPYFLIESEMVNWCTSQGIVTTTRGSAAGSLVLFVTGITQVDPLKYMLPFERFLNPFRPSPPDIDLDIADNRRGDLIAHITEVYGDDKVAQICTFGRMLARASVRDVGRVLGYPYSFPDKIAKSIPEGSQGFPMTLDKALKVSEEFKKVYQENSDAKRILDLARQIEGNARHTSVHAAGVVIAPSAMTDFSPLQRESGGEKAITQYEMHASEEVGLIKFDILGIRNLAILNSAIDIIKERLGISVDLKSIPLDDKSTFEMLARGETMGTFQLGGTGMTRYLMELKPERIEDIMAMVALFRPGPMANIPEYIKRKNDPNRVVYMHPKMKSFLESSYGILVYQEDILFTAIELAGYDWGSVDKLRKAIGKKNPEEMKRQEQIFLEGCQKVSNMDAKLAQQIWDLFVPFQGYGFNKAHAAAYGIVAYQTAYLKARYPVEYMNAVLMAEADNTDKVVQAIEECKRMGIPVLPPHINSSGSNFSIVPDESARYKKVIRFGLSAIKNVGGAAVDSIIDARIEVGEFKSLTHFCRQVDTRKVNKRVLESLIKVGAMDDFGPRKALIESLESIKQKALKAGKNSDGQGGLFDQEEDLTAIPTDDLLHQEEYQKPELLNFEKTLLGLYLTEHPMADALTRIAKEVTYKIGDLEPRLHASTFMTLGGIIGSVRTTTTKKTGAEMAFLRLEDESSSIDVVIFPRVWDEVKTIVEKDQPVLISGKLEARDDGLSFLASRIRKVPVSASPDSGDTSGYRINIPRGTDKSVLMELGALLKSNPGETSVIVLIPNGDTGPKEMTLPYKISVTADLESKINKILKI